MRVWKVLADHPNIKAKAALVSDKEKSRTQGPWLQRKVQEKQITM